MAYQKQTWKDLPDRSTPITAARLSHMETQYDQAVARLTGTTGISVMDFGAKGDGRTDDSSAIQNALSAVAPGGATVIFPPGVYPVSQRLRVRAGSRLVGPGATLSRTGTAGILLCNWPPSEDVGSPSATFTGYNGWGDILVDGLTFDGNGDTNTANTNMVTFGHARNITVRNTVFRRSVGYHALEINAIEDFLVEDCVFEGFLPKVDLLNKEAIQIDCAFPGDSGFADGTMAKNGVIQRILIRPFENMGAHTIGVGSHTLPPGSFYDNITVRDVHSEGTPMAAVWAIGWRDSLIDNLSSKAPGGFAVRVQESQDVAVVNCLSNASSWVSGTSQAFNISTNSKRIQVINPRVLGGNEGIYFGSGTQDCSVTGGVVSGTASYAIVLDSSLRPVVSGGFLSGGRKSSATPGTIRVTGNTVDASVLSTRVAPHGDSGTPEAQSAVSVAATATGTGVFGCDFKGMPAAVTGSATQTSNRI